jgi:hypothetical protein
VGTGRRRHACSLGAAAAFGAFGVVITPGHALFTARAYTLGIGRLLVTLIGLLAMVEQNWAAVTASWKPPW